MLLSLSLLLFDKKTLQYKRNTVGFFSPSPFCLIKAFLLVVHYQVFNWALNCRSILNQTFGSLPSRFERFLSCWTKSSHQSVRFHSIDFFLLIMFRFIRTWQIHLHPMWLWSRNQACCKWRIHLAISSVAAVCTMFCCRFVCLFSFASCRGNINNFGFKNEVPFKI